VTSGFPTVPRGFPGTPPPTPTKGYREASGWVSDPICSIDRSKGVADDRKCDPPSPGWFPSRDANGIHPEVLEQPRLRSSPKRWKPEGGVVIAELPAGV